jgi:hypothetical protein
MESVKFKLQKVCEALLEQQKHGEISPETLKYIEAIGGGVI